jgi:NAD(P)-dependent dehydrogenase (short-subunit alcohol dehydrogenase family)
LAFSTLSPFLDFMASDGKLVAERTGAEKMSQTQKVAFITGISRGLGKAIAEAFLSRGDVVIGTARCGKADLKQAAGKLHVLALDVTNREQVFRTVAAAHAIHHRLDVVVNNAGFGLLGAIEESSPAETDEVMAANFFGTLNVIQAVLPLLRAQRSGHIINISSIAGLAPKAGYGLYAAAKFAVEGMSQSLAEELLPLGIHVTLVEPGGFRTDFLSESSIRHAEAKIEAYSATSGQTINLLARSSGKQIGDPVMGAKAILQAVDSPAPPLHLLLGSDALRRARAKIEQMTQQINEWESVSLSTDFAETSKH